MKQNDASACYDRIIANQLSINSQREETPRNACTLRCKVLQQIKHHVQTSLRVSERSYGNNKSLIHEAIQGGDSSRTEWAFISIPLIKTL